MNVENFIKLAEYLEGIAAFEAAREIPHNYSRFNMGMFFSGITFSDEPTDDVLDKSLHRCGTAACIAGHVVILLGNRHQKLALLGKGDDHDNLPAIAGAKLLGIEENHRLFYQMQIETAADAAKVLRKLVEVGYCPNEDWTLSRLIASVVDTQHARDILAERQRERDDELAAQVEDDLNEWEPEPEPDFYTDRDDMF